ncbi:sensor histidine kinase [Streptomyces sp. NBC_01262]|uniref:sensor histidine kinase n=1 Tax=Streptomyces sp. NBC_01262 TaxID=2903803 RepID=UPI002E3019FC|nr:nitrate- and nitrite sensing domain-containing protein [Streptomyces sp. NBC_01262]
MARPGPVRSRRAKPATPPEATAVLAAALRRVRALRRRPLPGWRTVRGRVAVVLTVPTCLLLAMVGLAVEGRIESYDDARKTRSEVDLSLRVQNLVHELQRERGLTNGYLSGGEEYAAQLRAQRKKVDTALYGLRNEPAVVHSVQDKLDRLTPVRADVDINVADPTKTLDFYTAAITTLNAEDPASDNDARGDRELRDGLAAMQALAAAKESLALERGSLNGVFVAGSFTRTEFLDFTEVRAARLAALDRFKQVATAGQRAALTNAFSSVAAHSAQSYEELASRGVDGSPLHIDAEAWWDDMTTLVDALYAVQQEVGADLRTRTSQLSDAATTRLLEYLGAGLLALVLVTAAWWLASRSITRPLDALVRDADEVARQRLPEAVRRIQEDGKLPAEADGDDEDDAETPAAKVTRGAEEVTKVAEALRGVERTAVGLAAEQAVLRRNTTESLANLGRRNQGLIRRQLGLITRLENQELDPDALAELFELDHLATRMRRNAESLLVLVGQHTPRSSNGTANGLELVQSAIAEVEQYRRVMVATVEPCALRGHAVADLAHLLAEIVENALTFSPPTEPVEVHGWADGDEYCIAVVDHGVGMPAADLDRSNARLAGDDAFLVAPTRFLGHYVVGRLARRLDVEVRLFDTPGGGVSALVTIPARLLAPVTAPPEGPAAARKPPRTPENVSSMLNGFRAGVARAESR